MMKMALLEPMIELKIAQFWLTCMVNKMHLLARKMIIKLTLLKAMLKLMMKLALMEAMNKMKGSCCVILSDLS